MFLCGECVLTVQLSEEECVEDEEDVEFYLLFSGSTQRHLTTTLRLSHVTLQAVCPAHDRDEAVRVTLCQARPGGSVDPVAEERFQFVHDLALDMARFLISAAAHRDGLEGALLLADSHIPVQECERLDETLTLALKHLPLPPGWSVLGPDINTHSPTDFSPHETLLHFAARRGLRRVALFLLQQPGGQDALQLANKHGHTPARVAQSKGHTQLQHLLSELEKSPHLETKAPRRCYPAGRAFLHHPRLNTFTLTVENEADGEPLDLRRDVEELRRYAHSHCHNKGGSWKQRQSFPLILSRDFVGDLQTVAVTPSEDPSLQKPPAHELQEVVTEKESSEHAECMNGSAQSEGSAVPASSGSSDSGKRTLGLEGEGACAGKREDCAAVSTVSCGEQQQQQEEVDSEPRVIREAPHTQRGHTVSETKTHNKIQSGNTQEGTMGQTQGLLPEKEEKNKARGDLPEEREGERNSGQETSLPGGSKQPLDGQTNNEKRSRFYVNLDVNASEKGKEIQETGTSNERIYESTGCTKRDQDISEDLDSLSFRPNMAPGPVHNVRLEPSPVVKQSPDAAAGDEIDAPPETASECSEQASSDSIKEPPPCDDVTDAPGQPDRLELDVSLTTEESGGEISVDETLHPETEESSSPESKSDVQPIISPEISEEISQILTKSPCGDEEVSREHSEPRSDATDAQIMDIMDQNLDPVSPALFLDQISAVPPGLMVFDSNPEETGSGLESKLERDPLTFQTPPESPCEFFSVDGFIRTSDSIEATCAASLELGHPAGSGETMQEGEKVETELLEMRDSSKTSPLTILCGSFSKLTIRGSPLDPQLDGTTSETIKRISTSALAGDSETSNTHPSETEKTEMQENKEEDMKLEPNFIEKCERSETLQIVSNMTAAPPHDAVSQENLRGTAMIGYAVGSETPNDQPPESKDVQEEWMKMPTELGENPEISSLSCKTLSLSTSFSKSITDPHSEVVTFEEGNNQTSEDTQPELTTSTETIVKTSLDPHLEVSNFVETMLEQCEVMTFEESISETSLDLCHDLITSSEETIVGTSLDPLPEVKISEESFQGEQLNVMISEESISGTSLGCNHDFTSSVEIIGEASLGPLLEVNRPEESIEVQQLEKSRNDLFDPKHEVTTFEESIGGTLDFPHELITPSEVTVRETSFGPLPEVNSSEENVVHQQLEVMTSEESIRGTSLGPNHDLTMTFEETIGIMSLGPCSEVNSFEENILDQQPEATACEKSKNAASQDPKVEVTISEKSIRGPHHEVTIGETSLDQQPEITAFEENIRETPYHTQLEETTCEENLGKSLEPSPEVMSSQMDTCLPEAPVQNETGILYTPVSGNDSGLALENVSTSGSLRMSDQSMDLSSVMDLDSGTGVDIDASSPVEVESGLIQDLSPLDNVGVWSKGGTLDEEKSQTEQECGEEPKDEQVAGDDDRSESVLTHKDQCSEIHREAEEEVLYSLESEALKQECSKENTETDVPVASVCRSVSATSLPGSESISDGDSLLGPDATDDTVFKQSEDTLTLTSGISMTGSVSTDDSSITHTVGETEEEEKKDRLTEVLERSAILRSTSRSQSPSRRHSWGPSKNNTGETDMGQRSVVQAEEGEKPAGHRRSMSWCPSHVPRAEMDEMNSRR
ncbi:hypothetical protein PGIGA_G00239570 [Pangasianodon gigas]|uniref:Uncharacterized protein n=1 Tax=Pangasianodon gigas TaxID=30993 RepID=A0ACC5WNJ4_PANGG|nr:hypothetical protein [Pangasianodon gigas]